MIITTSARNNLFPASQSSLAIDEAVALVENDDCSDFGWVSFRIGPSPFDLPANLAKRHAWLTEKGYKYLPTPGGF